MNINLLLTKHNSIRTNTTKGYYTPVQCKQDRFSKLKYDSQKQTKYRYMAYDYFHGNSPYGKILTNKEPIISMGFTP